jgi:transcriptional/translational regulatory protein YebC/TACO1
MSFMDWFKSLFHKEEETEEQHEIEVRRQELKARQEALAHESEEIYKTAANMATATTQGLSVEEQEKLQKMLRGELPIPEKDTP